MSSSAEAARASLSSAEFCNSRAHKCSVSSTDSNINKAHKISLTSTEGSNSRQTIRQNLETSASMLRDMLIGRGINRNNNNNYEEVKLRHKPRRQASSADSRANRHSLHGQPWFDHSQPWPHLNHHRSSSIYADPYQQQQQHIYSSGQQSPYYFNHLDGYIYVNNADPSPDPWRSEGDPWRCSDSNPTAKDSVRRKVESRKRMQQRRALFPAPFASIPPLLASTPPPSMHLHAPYYVADTLHESSRSLSSPPYSDQAEDRGDSSLDASFFQHESGNTSFNGPPIVRRRVESRSPERRATVMVLDRGSQAAHRFDIRDYALLEAGGGVAGNARDNDAAAAARRSLADGSNASTTPSRGRYQVYVNARQQQQHDHQHECCQCECHHSAAEDNRPTRRSSSLAASSINGSSTDVCSSTSNSSSSAAASASASAAAHCRQGRSVDSAAAGLVAKAACLAGAHVVLQERKKSGDAADDQRLTELQRVNNSGASVKQQRQLLALKEHRGSSLQKSESVREYLAGPETEDGQQQQQDRKYRVVNGVKRRLKPARADGQQLNRSVMVLEGGPPGAWGGVSGVPGLGVSIPARPQSACELDVHDVAWSAPSRFESVAGKSLSQRKLKHKRRKDNNDNDNKSNKSSSSSNENDSATSWNPNSLQSLSHLKLDLPRVSSVPSGASEKSAPSHRHSLRRTSPITLESAPSFRKSSNNASARSNASGAIARLNQLSSKQPLSANLSHSSVSQNIISHHTVLAGAKSSSAHNQFTVAQVHWSDDPEFNPDGNSNVQHRQMPWQDSVVNMPMKRNLQRQSYHWDGGKHGSSDHQQQHNTSASSSSSSQQEAAARKKSSFDKRFPHLAAIIKSESAAAAANSGPHSLPLRFESRHSIPRPPIPVPDEDKPSESDSEKEEDEGNYETLHEPPVKTHVVIVQQKQPQHHQPEFSRRSLIQHVQSSTDNSYGSSSHDETFDSVEIPLSNQPGSQLYKVLHDRDGDYAYAYDCSLSPAFLIRYNDEHPSSSSSEESENIYEEITEVKKRIDPPSKSRSKKSSEEKIFHSSGSSSKSSTKADSGVHMSQRKFSSDTLDFGPNSKPGGLNRRSRFSNGSADSFAISETSAEEERAKSRQSGKSHLSAKRSNLKPTKSVPVIPVRTVSNEEFCEIIRRHHNRVLEQLRIDPDDFDEKTGSPAPDSTPTGSESHEAAAERKYSLSKFKAMRLGFANLRGKSAGSLKSDNNNEVAAHAQQARKMTRCESMDVSLEEANNRAASAERASREASAAGQPQAGGKGGWLQSARKYSDAFNKKYLSKSVSAVSEDSKAAAGDEHEVPVDEAFSDQPGQRFQRSRITSRWENLHSLPE